MLPPGTLWCVGQVRTCRCFGGICYVLPSSGWKIKDRGISRLRTYLPNYTPSLPNRLHDSRTKDLWPQTPGREVRGEVWQLRILEMAKSCTWCEMV